MPLARRAATGLAREMVVGAGVFVFVEYDCGV